MYLKNIIDFELYMYYLFLLVIMFFIFKFIRCEFLEKLSGKSVLVRCRSFVVIWKFIVILVRSLKVWYFFSFIIIIIEF